MRALLVNPYCPLSEHPAPPLGLAFVAGALEQAGVEVQILDLVTHPYDRETFASLLASFQPRIVGSTSVTMTFDAGRKVIQDAKSIDPDIVTVMGGPHVSFCPEDTLAAVPELDLIVIGEGEGTIVDIAREAEGRRNWADVLGLAYRDNGTVRCTERRPPLGIDSLPQPARHLMPLGRYRALNMAISMTTSRGCPFSCIFCVGRRMLGPKVRYRDPQAVVDELEYLAGLGFPQVNLADDLFTAKKSHCFAICDEILARGLRVKWSCFARVDTVSPDLLRKLKEAGCTAVAFGIETGNEEILKTIRKKITLPQVVAAVDMCCDAGVLPHASFILGLPGETPDTVAESVRFVKMLEARGAACGFHLLAPFPGTAVRDECEKYGLRILTNDWTEYHANRAIVETSTVTAAMFDAIVDEPQRELEERLARAKQQLEAGEPLDADDPGYENLERVMFLYDLMMTRAIEEDAPWVCNGVPPPNDEAVRALASRVYQRTRNSEQRAYHILTQAVTRGDIRCVRNGDTARWVWTDHL
jgi:anaerobic magnesium-protoporphyrin IX monomethyl ester cyclase